MILAPGFLALATIVTQVPVAQDGAPGKTFTIRGEVTGASKDKGDALAGPIVVRCYRLHTTKGGRAQKLSKHDFYHLAPTDELLTDDGKFECKGLTPGHYSVVAYQDVNHDGKLGFDPSEPLGWFCAETSGWIDPIDLRTASANIKIGLRTTTPFQYRAIQGSTLTKVKGLPVLRLRGDEKKRGHAHGALLGRQILDFFEFYILEDKFKSAKKYQTTFVPFLQTNFRYPTAFLTEIDAVIAGMKASRIDMRVRSLGRDFDRTDLLAINAYIETRAMRSSCTQYAFWGAHTEGTDVKGGLIAGRNMDGEVDVRKTTVSHFVVFAVDQEDKTKKRYLNLMWPGFVGTITGINEDGLYSMENAGQTGPGPVEDSLVPISWIQRFILENVSGDAGPQAITSLIKAHRSSGSGSCGPGCIILFALPFRDQASPAFVFEGDRFGGAMRLPGEVRPRAKTMIMATNHFLKYGVHADKPGQAFGKTPYFSSRWRYEAGMHLVESWNRQEKKIGTKEMVRLLQTAAHGTTEHTIIFRANQMSLDIAVDDLAADMWDAPYQPFRTFGFEEFFGKK